jgi:hypothetical protein
MREFLDTYTFFAAGMRYSAHADRHSSYIYTDLSWVYISLDIFSAYSAFPPDIFKKIGPGKYTENRILLSIFASISPLKTHRKNKNISTQNVQRINIAQNAKLNSLKLNILNFFESIILI